MHAQIHDIFMRAPTNTLSTDLTEEQRSRDLQFAHQEDNIPGDGIGGYTRNTVHQEMALEVTPGIQYTRRWHWRLHPEYSTPGDGIGGYTRNTVHQEMALEVTPGIQYTRRWHWRLHPEYSIPGDGIGGYTRNTVHQEMAMEVTPRDGHGCYIRKWPLRLHQEMDMEVISRDGHGGYTKRYQENSTPGDGHGGYTNKTVHQEMTMEVNAI